MNVAYLKRVLYLCFRSLVSIFVRLSISRKLLNIVGEQKINFFPGFSNTIARFASGWLTTIPHASPLLVHNIGLCIAGVVTLLLPLCSTYELLVAYSTVWGGTIGKFRLFLLTQCN